MDRKAILEPGTNRVINVAVVDPENVPADMLGFPWADWSVSVGCTYVPDTNTFLPPPPPPPPSPEELIAQLTSAIDNVVEQTARSRQYNSAAHMASYVASTVPQWAAEAQAFVAWRDQVWVFALTELAQIQAGAKPVPQTDDLLNALPAPVWT